MKGTGIPVLWYSISMKRGPYRGRNELLDAAIVLREEGYGYCTIGKKLQVPPMTIRNWVSNIKADRRVSQELGSRHRIVCLEDQKTKVGIRRALLRERGHRCEKCGGESWLGRKIPLDVHHKDGNKDNNKRENLQLLCCNCHALTPNYKGKNIKKSFARLVKSKTHCA